MKYFFFFQQSNPITKSKLRVVQLLDWVIFLFIYFLLKINVQAFLIKINKMKK